jgi:hypothetical protein
MLLFCFFAFAPTVSRDLSPLQNPECQSLCPALIKDADLCHIRYVGQATYQIAAENKGHSRAHSCRCRNYLLVSELQVNTADVLKHFFKKRDAGDLDAETKGFFTD